MTKIYLTVNRCYYLLKWKVFNLIWQFASLFEKVKSKLVKYLSYFIIIYSFLIRQIATLGWQIATLGWQIAWIHLVLSISKGIFFQLFQSFFFFGTPKNTPTRPTHCSWKGPNCAAFLYKWNFSIFGRSLLISGRDSLINFRSLIVNFLKFLYIKKYLIK